MKNIEAKLNLTPEEIIYIINVLAAQPYRNVADLISRFEAIVPKPEPKINEDTTPA